MKRLLLCSWLASVAGCARCTKPVAPADAGTHRRADSDVRTALMFSFPEYRGAMVQRAVARVTRKYTTLPRTFADTGLKSLGWVTSGDGGWHVSAFNIEQVSADALSLSFTLDDEHVHRLFEAPLGASNAEMGHYLPAENLAGETFVFEVDYVTAPARASFLMKQLGTLLLANQQWVATLPEGWDAIEPDGGAFAPDPLDVTFTAVQDGARVRLVRVGGHVVSRYELVTDELLP